jgi:diguanylate cyclase
MCAISAEVSQARADYRGMVWIVLGVLAVLYVLLARRASARLRVQAAANEHAALHDPVTELPNRVLFHERVHRAIREGAAAVLMIDLDRFKEINDTLGHHNGDLLLCMVGARLAGEADCVARLGGDEFAVLVTADPEAAAGRIRAAISERLELEGIGVEVEASIGIATYPEHGADP